MFVSFGGGRDQSQLLVGVRGRGSESWKGCRAQSLEDVALAVLLPVEMLFLLRVRLFAHQVSTFPLTLMQHYIRCSLQLGQAILGALEPAEPVFALETCGP